MPAFLSTLAQLLGLLCCLIILVRAEPAINRMGNLSPPFIVRFAFALLVTGALSGILSILTGGIPDAHTLILLAGTAALTLCERRIRILSGTRHRPNPQRKGLPHAQG